MQELLGFFDAIASGQIMESLNLGWLALGWFIGLMNDPKKVSAMVVNAVKKFVPGPFKLTVLRFLDRVAKGIDKEIPDDIKAVKQVENKS